MERCFDERSCADFALNPDVSAGEPGVLRQQRDPQSNLACGARSGERTLHAFKQLRTHAAAVVAHADGQDLPHVQAKTDFHTAGACSDAVLDDVGEMQGYIAHITLLPVCGTWR